MRQVVPSLILPPDWVKWLPRLEPSVLNIQEVMYGVGYNDEKAIRNTFRKYTGLLPMAYRSKYNREMAFA